VENSLVGECRMKILSFGKRLKCKCGIAPASFKLYILNRLRFTAEIFLIRNDSQQCVFIIYIFRLYFILQYIVIC
jgi:hypothetical protein